MAIRNPHVPLKIIKFSVVNLLPIFSKYYRESRTSQSSTNIVPPITLPIMRQIKAIISTFSRVFLGKTNTVCSVKAIIIPHLLWNYSRLPICHGQPKTLPNRSLPHLCQTCLRVQDFLLHSTTPTVFKLVSQPLPCQLVFQMLM